MKKNAALAISVLAGLLVALSATLIYLVQSEFAAERHLSGTRAAHVALQKDHKTLGDALTNRIGELANLRKQSQQTTAEKDVAQTGIGQKAQSLQTQLTARDVELLATKKSLESATNELNHALKQFRLVETELQQRLKDAQAKQVVPDAGSKSTAILLQQLQAEHQKAEEALAHAAALQKTVDEANRELAQLRLQLAKLQNQPTQRPTPTSTPPTAVDTVPLQTPTVTAPVKPAVAAVPAGASGVVLNVDSDFGFITASLNPTQGVLVGAPLKVTRNGQSVGVLKVTRIQREGLVFADVVQITAGQSITVGDRVDLQR